MGPNSSGFHGESFKLKHMNDCFSVRANRGPQRIVCLSTETVDTLYRLDQQDKIVGISGFSVHPPQARKEKPKISAYTTAKIDQILALKPDLVLGFSDLQADMASELVRLGIEVHVFNQRSIAGIFEAIATLGRLVNEPLKAKSLMQTLEQHMDQVAKRTERNHRPRVYFEEWDDPMMCGIAWVSELIEWAGGVDVFADQAQAPSAKERIIEDPATVAAATPDLIIGSWCGKKFRPERVAERPGFASIPAVINQQLIEIKSADILQPGPVALTRGLDQLASAIDRVAGERPI